MTWIRDFWALFGNPQFMWLLAFGFVYWSLMLSPIFVAAFRAFSKRDRLPRPILFIAVVAGLSYGWLWNFLGLVGIPGGIAAIYIVPNMVAEGMIQNGPIHWTFATADQFVKWWPLYSPLLPLLIAFPLKIWLGRRWRSICNAISA